MTVGYGLILVVCAVIFLISQIIFIINCIIVRYENIRTHKESAACRLESTHWRDHTSMEYTRRHEQDSAVISGLNTEIEELKDFIAQSGKIDTYTIGPRGVEMCQPSDVIAKDIIDSFTSGGICDEDFSKGTIYWIRAIVSEEEDVHGEDFSTSVFSDGTAIAFTVKELQSFYDKGELKIEN